MEEELRKLESTNKILTIICIIILILTICLGVLNIIEYNSDDNCNGNSTSLSGTEQRAIATFNEQFKSYLGNTITAQQAKILISKVNESNYKYSEHKVEILGDYTKISVIVSGKRYSAIEEYDENGYIISVKIADEIK